MLNAVCADYNNSNSNITINKTQFLHLLSFCSIYSYLCYRNSFEYENYFDQHPVSLTSELATETRCTGSFLEVVI